MKRTMTSSETSLPVSAMAGKIGWPRRKECVSLKLSRAQTRVLDGVKT